VSVTLELAHLPRNAVAGETTNPAAALRPNTFLVVSQGSDQIGHHKVSLFKIENGRIILKDKADIELSDMNQQTTLARQGSAEWHRFERPS
jgi:hypothetical protein